MSITLNNSDFQCLQDQLVELRTKNYELAEKTKRSQADFEAAKAKICTLQLKLEEQERDFQVTSSTLRREIESVTGSSTGSGETIKDSKEEDYKSKYKKLLHKAKELQQRYEKSLEVVQQLDEQNKILNEKVIRFEADNHRLKEATEVTQKQLDLAKEEHEEKLAKAIEEYKQSTCVEIDKLDSSLDDIKTERDELKKEVEKLTSQISNFDSRLEVQAEEHRIQERKGIQIVKELKRQLASEKNRTETLQKRLENLLSEPSNGNNADLENTRLSTSSSTNENSSSNGNGSRANQDANSVGSWSFVPVKSKSSNQGMNETLSLCSIDSEDRATVHQPCDTTSENSSQHVATSIDENSKHSLSATNSSGLSKQVNTPLSVQVENLKKNIISYPSYASSQLTSDRVLIEEQAALVERLTRLQHDKWMLEEKLSYMEQANSALTEDLANKSDIIKHYFMDQAIKAIYLNQSDLNKTNNNSNANLTSRRTSIPSNANQLLHDQSSLKKVMNFLKERSQISSNESESICRETTKKMQLMLEETLIKCIKLQENLDFVTSELNKLKS